MKDNRGVYISRLSVADNSVVPGITGGACAYGSERNKSKKAEMKERRRIVKSLSLPALGATLDET